MDKFCAMEGGKLKIFAEGMRETEKFCAGKGFLMVAKFANNMLSAILKVKEEE